MSLSDRLMEDLKQAMRQNDAMRKDAIRMVRAAIQNTEIAKQHTLDDNEVIEVIRKEVKQRQEAIAMFAQGGRQDLVEQETKQVKILEAYLPQQMSADDIAALAKQAIAAAGAKGPADMGLVMRTLMGQLKGQADGKLVNQVVQKLLNDKA
ncbi:MAG: GatB/YqeY domain-containing protein [Chloroflexi bacterium]|nr:GatB/YqeY domain-containing protein [Chloroflexota bacterium]